MSENAVAIDQLIDRQRLRPINFWYVAVLLLALMADGFDLQVMGFAAPSLVRDWGVKRADLAPVLSASLVGVLFGAPLLGALGDRIGRKTTIVMASVLYGGFSLACAWAPSLEILVWLRFLTGLGIGGVLPNVMALSTELAPRRHRALLTGLVVVGINIGSGTIGVVRAALPVQHEWRWLFVVGAAAPIVVAALIAVGLPESILFLASRGRRDQVARRARSMDPDLPIDGQTTFTLDAPAKGGGLKAIFAGRYALITGLLWLVFASSLFTIYIRTSWLPLLLDDAGVSRGRVAVVSVLVDSAGTVTGLISGFLLGRLGLAWAIALLLLGAAGMACLARLDISTSALELAAIAVGAGIVGGQAALNTSASLIYPANCRPTGVGAALGLGRLGAISGPLIGGAIIALGATPRDMFLVPLVPLTLAVLALLWLRRLADVKGATPP